MTKTKTQKLRARMARENVNTKKGGQRKLNREINFLNGNTLSFLNGVAARANTANRNNLGQQARSKRVSPPTATGFAGLSSKARVTTMDSGITKVRHSEYIKDLDASADFSAEAFPINPGTSEIFPWLSTIARRYESYQFKNLNFRFETTSPTNTAGTVIITIDYNPQGKVPTSKTQALAMESAVRTPTWGSVNHRSLSHNLAKRKSYYVRSPTSAMTDVDLYDTGLMVTMVEGVPVDSVPSVGELYVDYEVDLITPVLDSDITATETIKVISTTPLTSVDGAFPFDIINSVEPPGSEIIVGGPGKHVTSSVGHAGIFGAFEFRRRGNFLVVMDWLKADGAPLLNTNFGLGKFSVPNHATIDIVNLTPGGQLAMVDSTDDFRAISMFAVRVSEDLSSGYPLFGIGTVDTCSGSGLQVTTRITDYADLIN